MQIEQHASHSDHHPTRQHRMDRIQRLREKFQTLQQKAYAHLCLPPYISPIYFHLQAKDKTILREKVWERVWRTALDCAFEIFSCAYANCARSTRVRSPSTDRVASV